MKKQLGIVLTASAIVTSVSLPSVAEIENHNATITHDRNPVKTTFVCSLEVESPTMYAYTPGKIALEPIMTWHPEYLLEDVSGAELCQNVVSKLQTLSPGTDKKYIATQEKEDKISVCLVSNESLNCDSEGSEYLFSVNPNYNPSCVLESRDPLECVAISNNRGVFSSQESPYTPMWWFW